MEENKTYIVYVYTVLLCIVMGYLTYVFFGHKLIKLVYDGRSIEFLNSFIKGQKNAFVESYFMKGDIIVIIGSILFLSFAISPVFIFRVSRKAHINILYIKNKLGNLKEALTKNKKVIFLSLGIFIFFFVLYFMTGYSLARIPGYQTNKIFFGSEHTEIINGWVKPVGFHYHKGAHPLILLIGIPIASLLNFLLSSKVLAALLMVHFFGALAAAMAFIFFWILTKKDFIASLLAVLFGLSASQLIYSSIPETHSFAAASIILTYIVFLVSLRKKKIYFGLWVLAGILSFGVTSINFVQTLICFIAALLVSEGKKRKILVILEYISVTIFIAFWFSLLQSIIFPQAELFFMPQVYLHAIKFVNPIFFEQTLVFVIKAVKNFFLINFIAPPPVILPIDLNHIRVYFLSRNYGYIGFMGALLWVCLLLTVIFRNIFREKRNIFFVAISLIVLFNMFFYTFYATKGKPDMFRFSCNFTFPALLLAIPSKYTNRFFFATYLTLLIVLIGINNQLAIRQILAIFGL